MEVSDLPKDKKIVLFDGVCNLCDSSVQFIIRQDKSDIFRFVSLESELGQKITKHIGVDTNKIDSIILYEPNVAYYFKAEAIIRIAKYLGGAYSFFAIFSIFPKGFLNAIYAILARKRYKWFGKKESCLIPSAELKSKFLE